jgi:hypothetical protein
MIATTARLAALTGHVAGANTQAVCGVFIPVLIAHIVLIG